MFTCTQLHKLSMGSQPRVSVTAGDQALQRVVAADKSLNELFNWPGEVTTCLRLLIPNDSGLLAVCASTSICT